MLGKYTNVHCRYTISMKHQSAVVEVGKLAEVEEQEAPATMAMTLALLLLLLMPAHQHHTTLAQQ